MAIRRGLDGFATHHPSNSGGVVEASAHNINPLIEGKLAEINRKLLPQGGVFGWQFILFAVHVVQGNN